MKYIHTNTDRTQQTLITPSFHLFGVWEKKSDALWWSARQHSEERGDGTQPAGCDVHTALSHLISPHVGSVELLNLIWMWTPVLFQTQDRIDSERFNWLLTLILILLQASLLLRSLPPLSRSPPFIGAHPAHPSAPDNSHPFELRCFLFTSL